MSDPSEEAEPEFEQPNSDQEGERLVLAAAETIRNLVADRRSPRNKVAAQERDLTRLGASRLYPVGKRRAWRFALTLV